MSSRKPTEEQIWEIRLEQYIQERIESEKVMRGLMDDIISSAITASGIVDNSRQNAISLNRMREKRTTADKRIESEKVMRGLREFPAEKDIE